MAKAKAPKAPKRMMGRTVISSVRLQMGLVTMTGNFCAVRKSETSAKPTVNGEKITVESACPTHYDGDGSFAKLKQVYLCEDDQTHGPFARNDAMKAVDGKVIASTEEYHSAGKDEDADSSEDKEMLLVAHYADEVDQYTVFTGAAYAFDPSGAHPLYDILLCRISPDGTMDVGEERRAVLLGEVAQRGKKHLFQLRTWNGQLLMQELARPEDMYDMESVEANVDERFDTMFTQLVAATVEEFDPATYEDESRRRLAEFVAAKTEHDGPALEVLVGGKSDVLKDAGADAMLAMLSASVDAAKAKRAS